MPELEDYRGQIPAWCPGCGNFQLLKAFKQAMVELGVEPHGLIVVSGIGQAGKLPHYTRCNTFNGLHGRTLPVATAIRLVNHGMPVIAEAGDGDCYGEGGNHFLHAMRRNINVKLFVHDNQIYGLTKGQASPTSGQGMMTKTQPFGVLPENLNPVALAVAMNASFVARGFTGDTDFLKELLKRAMEHRGFALVDILQNCVVFNKINTSKWYKERVYHIKADEHDPTDREAAFQLALEFGERIPTGVIYRNDRPVFEDSLPVIATDPLVKQPYSIEDVAGEIQAFF
ncbi:MAG: 2-oxoacid:ferredoxin oxidoreductase subunit beta [Thermoleophilia bacterium]|nr:2-oxoacid:ferredoxin oxidoreductase subunit beta [Thermoleophilia bacterium]